MGRKRDYVVSVCAVKPKYSHARNTTAGLDLLEICTIVVLLMTCTLMVAAEDQYPSRKYSEKHGGFGSPIHWSRSSATFGGSVSHLQGEGHQQRLRRSWDKEGSHLDLLESSGDGVPEQHSRRVSSSDIWRFATKVPGVIGEQVHGLKTTPSSSRPTWTVWSSDALDFVYPPPESEREDADVDIKNGDLSRSSFPYLGPSVSIFGPMTSSVFRIHKPEASRTDHADSSERVFGDAMDDFERSFADEDNDAVTNADFPRSPFSNYGPTSRVTDNPSVVYFDIGLLSTRCTSVIGRTTIGTFDSAAVSHQGPGDYDTEDVDAISHTVSPPEPGITVIPTPVFVADTETQRTSKPQHDNEAGRRSGHSPQSSDTESRVTSAYVDSLIITIPHIVIHPSFSSPSATKSSAYIDNRLPESTRSTGRGGEATSTAKISLISQIIDLPIDQYLTKPLDHAITSPGLRQTSSSPNAAETIDTFEEETEVPGGRAPAPVNTPTTDEPLVRTFTEVSSPGPAIRPTSITYAISAEDQHQPETEPTAVHPFSESSADRIDTEFNIGSRFDDYATDTDFFGGEIAVTVCYRCSETYSVQSTIPSGHYARSTAVLDGSSAPSSRWLHDVLRRGETQPPLQHSPMVTSSSDADELGTSDTQGDHDLQMSSSSREQYTSSWRPEITGDGKSDVTGMSGTITSSTPTSIDAISETIIHFASSLLVVDLKDSASGNTSVSLPDVTSETPPILSVFYYPPNSTASTAVFKDTPATLKPSDSDESPAIGRTSASDHVDFSASGRPTSGHSISSDGEVDDLRPTIDSSRSGHHCETCPEEKTTAASGVPSDLHVHVHVTGSDVQKESHSATSTMYPSAEVGFPWQIRPEVHPARDFTQHVIIYTSPVYTIVTVYAGTPSTDQPPSTDDGGDGTSTTTEMRVTPSNDEESSINISWLLTDMNASPTGVDPFDDQRYWIRTVIKVSSNDEAAMQNLTNVLERRLEDIFEVAFKRQGRYLWRRVSRNRRQAEEERRRVDVKILNATLDESGQQMELIYTVAYDQILVPSKLAIDVLSMLSNDEVVEMLGYKLVRNTEEYLHREEYVERAAEKRPIWLAYILGGTLAGLFLFCIFCFIIYYRCFQRSKKRRRGSDDSEQQIATERIQQSFGEQNRQQIFSQEISHTVEGGGDGNRKDLQSPPPTDPRQSVIPGDVGNDGENSGIIVAPGKGKQSRTLPSVPQESEMNQRNKEILRKSSRKYRRLLRESREQMVTSETQTEADGGFDNEAFIAEDEDGLPAPAGRHCHQLIPKASRPRSSPGRESSKRKRVRPPIATSQKQERQSKFDSDLLALKGGLFDYVTPPPPPSPTSLTTPGSPSPKVTPTRAAGKPEPQPSSRKPQARFRKQVYTIEKATSAKRADNGTCESHKVNVGASSEEEEESETEKQLWHIRKKIGELLDDALTMTRPKRWYHSVRGKKVTPKVLVKQRSNSFRSPLRRTRSASTRIPKSSEDHAPTDNESLLDVDPKRPKSSPAATEDILKMMASRPRSAVPRQAENVPWKMEAKRTPMPKFVWSDAKPPSEDNDAAEKSSLFSPQFPGSPGLSSPAFRRPAGTMLSGISAHSQAGYLSPLSRFANYRPFAVLSIRPFGAAAALQQHSTAAPITWKPSAFPSRPSSATSLFTSRRLSTVPTTSLPVLDPLRDTVNLRPTTCRLRSPLTKSHEVVDAAGPSRPKPNVSTTGAQATGNLPPEVRDLSETAADSDYDEIDAVSKLKIREPAKSVIEAIKLELQKFNSSISSSNTESTA